jgi:apolipoprotein N-acyltransferase
MVALSQLSRRILSYPRLCAFALGALATCGFQPIALWPPALIGVAGLLALVAAAPGWRQAAVVGWVFGLGLFWLGNNWIATSFTYQSNMPAWLGWVGVFLVALYLAIFPALAALAAWPFRRNGVALVLAFAGWWIVTEWMRGWVLSGYAWNPLGVAALGGFDRAGLAQLAPWTGTYALSGLVALLAGAWWLAWQWRARRAVALGLVFLPVAAMLVPELSPPDAPGTLALTLVQPNIRQPDLENPAKFETQFRGIAALSQRHDPGGRRIVLWPESGVPDYLREGYPQYLYLETTYAADPLLARRRIGRVAGPGSMVLTGSVDLEMRKGSVAAARNVVTVLDEGGAIRASYAKAHLVPFGEYLPLRPLLEPLGMSRLVAGTLDFWPGPGPRTLDLGGWGKAGIQICYEIVFSGQVVDRRNRPDYIFNPSNDGWFGSWGPPQHLAQARLRAIEEGLPVLRATTSGISAVIDANGIVRQYVPRFVAGRLDGMVPRAHPPTLFARLGNMLALAWAAVLLGASLLVLRRGAR